MENEPIFATLAAVRIAEERLKQREAEHCLEETADYVESTKRPASAAGAWSEWLNRQELSNPCILNAEGARVAKVVARKASQSSQGGDPAPHLSEISAEAIALGQSGDQARRGRRRAPGVPVHSLSFPPDGVRARAQAVLGPSAKSRPLSCAARQPRCSSRHPHCMAWEADADDRAGARSRRRAIAPALR